MANWPKYDRYELLKYDERNIDFFKVTGSGYNGEGDVLSRGERISYDSHPAIAKIIEVGRRNIVEH
jgi:hypothetical protein